MCSTAVTITADATTVRVASPYNPDFAPAAKRLGGRWEPTTRTWLFDLRDEARVRDLCRRIYGTDGTVATGDLVTLRLTATCDVASDVHGGLYAAGRQIAHASGRDSGARLGGGIVVLSGRVTSGGSVKNWYTVMREGAVVLIRDVPREAAEREIAEWTTRGLGSADIVPEQTPAARPIAVDRAALEAERARLLARLAEIDATLGGDAAPAPAGTQAAAVAAIEPGALALGQVIDGSLFKPDASPAPAGARCAVCGTTHHVAWIAGAGEALCAAHQDDY